MTLTAYVYARDPVSRAGITAQLELQPDVRVVDDCALREASVVIAVVDRWTDRVASDLRRLRQAGPASAVLVTTRINDAALLDAIDAGVTGIVHRSDATPDALMAAAAAVAAGDGALPQDVVGRLMACVARLKHDVLAPNHLNHAGLSEREVEVLRLVSEGYDTGEIAAQLAYSERTIKTIVHDVTNRLGVRNRAHAVAYAIREGIL